MLLSTDCLHPHACGQHEGSQGSRWPTFGVQPLRLAFSERMSFCFVNKCCRVADEDAPALFCRVWQVGLLCSLARASYTRWCNLQKSTSRNHSQICKGQLREQGTRLTPSLADEDVRPREGFARLWTADVLDQWHTPPAPAVKKQTDTKWGSHFVVRIQLRNKTINRFNFLEMGFDGLGTGGKGGGAAVVIWSLFSGRAEAEPRRATDRSHCTAWPLRTSQCRSASINCSVASVLCQALEKKKRKSVCVIVCVCLFV
jgi:hypothetical protein